MPLIKSYQSHIEMACELFRTRLGVSGNILAAWRRIPTDGYDSDCQSKIDGSGMLDAARKITYSFHGIGCRVRFGSLDVDFDFGPNGRYGGFDAWRLHSYAKSSKQFQDISDPKLIQAELTAMEAAEFICRPTGSLDSHLYYFSGSSD